MGKKPRIILIDADVVSHFIHASEHLQLHLIFPNPIHVLDKVQGELILFPKKKKIVENLIEMKILIKKDFPEDDFEIKKEFAHIRKLMFKGEGESACMAVARFSDVIIASSNLIDIKHYCGMHKIDYLTTMDFLCYALSKGKWDENRCDNFISAVLKAGGKLPVKRMSDWNCRQLDFI